MSAYAAFLEHKRHAGDAHGFHPSFLPDFLFDFQHALVSWAVRQGRAAIFADCGLGKTPMQLVWAENVVRHTNRPVLVLTPLAVTDQTVREAEKFGIEAVRSRDGTAPSGARVVVTNYERLHHFDPADFAGVVCDESSILKSFDGVRRGEVTHFARKLLYRLLCTATAAPNDYVELGTSSEALGELGYTDMLNRFFKNDLNNSSTGRGYLGSANEWRFKAHAESAFWRWVCSWARAVRRPSDLGFEDGRFILPPLVERPSVVTAARPRDGLLFELPAVGLQEQREELRLTVRERCERAAELLTHDEPGVAWCHLNVESDLLASLIPDAQQVSGAQSDDAKEELFLAFGSGELRVLVTKPKIGAWGLNWQHCAHMTVFPSHSFEQYYQSVRRCWRFGQTREVVVDVITTEGQRGVMANLTRKATAAAAMFDALVAHMNDAVRIERAGAFATPAEMPTWL